jgi:outer membrane protein assembly factor BamB
MEDHEGFGFDEFSIEMEDYAYEHTKKFDRLFVDTEGGSFSQKPMILDGIAYVGGVDRNVYAIDANTGELIWKFTADKGFLQSSPEAGEGLIFIGSHDMNLYALDAKSGALAWKFKTFGKITTSPHYHEGKVYFGSNDYNAYCVDSKTGELIWKFRTQGEVVCRPGTHEDKLFVGSYDHNLYCLDKNTGAQIWKFLTQGEIFNNTPFIVHDNVVFFPSFDNMLRAVDIDSARLVWKFKTGSYGGLGAGPFLYKDRLYQYNREGVIYALSLDGKEVWNFRINNAVAVPIVHKDRVYFGTEEQNLYCLDMDGDVLWKFPTQGIMWYCCSIWEDKVYFTSWDCYVYCVDINTHQLVWKFRGQGEPAYVASAFESYELKVKKEVTSTGIEDTEKRKKYDFDAGENEDSVSQYKSRVTYQMSTQYASKGKYQVDSDEEAF